MIPFPSSAPYRVDQVMAAPALMAGLWLLQPLLALALAGAARAARWRLWWGLAAALLAAVALFFTLASWGTSDVTKLSHILGAAPQRLPPGEPLWHALAPLLLRLPYRMAAVAGLVAAGYAAVPLLLARRAGMAAWAGAWALLVVCSPLERSFLQNGISRQAMAVLLLVPLLLAALGLLRGAKGWIALSTGLAALAHTTFPLSLAAALAPGLGRWSGAALRRGAAAPVDALGTDTDAATARERRALAQPLVLLLLLGGLLLAAVLLAQVLPQAWLKLQLYSQRETFFSRYPILPEVLRLQLSLVISVVLVLVRRGLGPLALLRCPLGRSLLGYGALLLGIQVSVRTGWMAPITFRLADLVGFFLLLVFLVWLARQRAGWAVLPPLAITLHSWWWQRLWSPVPLECGLDDDFLCIPDRLPWLLHY